MRISESGELKKVIVCSPRVEYFNVDDSRKHNIREIAMRKTAIEQHAKLRRVMEENGVNVIDVPELNGHPNSVFVRDTSVCTSSGFIKLRMGLESRRGEEEWMSDILRGMGMGMAGRIIPPGTVEGGDIILSDNVAFIGISRRTDENGAKQISEILKGMDYEPRFIRVPEGHLHLGGAMSLISRDTIIATNTIENCDEDFDVIRIEDADFISGNVITLGKNRVIVEKRNFITREVLESHGFIVTALDLSEFVKGSGGPSCLILPVERV